MTPAKPPLPSQPSGPPRVVRPGPAAVPAPVVQAAPEPPRGVPLGLAGVLIGLAGVVLAVAASYGMTVVLGTFGLPWATGAGQRMSLPLVASLAAAFGVVVAGLPLGWFMFKLARAVEIAGGRGAAGDVPAAGMARPMFLDLAEREFARARRYGGGAALLIVDVDRFTRLVEARGPAVGDAVLAELLRQTAPTLRTADVLTQFGGSQMAIFLAQADATGALDVAERIRERTEQLEVPSPEGVQAQRLRVTVSAGVAHLRPAHLNLQALIDDAQDAVVAARQAGGNCVRAAPVELGASGMPGAWKERRARPKQQGGPA